MIVLVVDFLEILSFRVGPRLCALPLQTVQEIMRPLASLPVETKLPFHLRLSLIRGKPCPVVDLARLLGMSDPPTRLILLKLAEGPRVALSVTSIEGVARVAKSRFLAKPSLMDGAARDLTEALAVFDGELLSLLQAGALLYELDGALVESR